MSFMEHDYTSLTTWIVIDGTNGITYLEADTFPEIQRAINLGNDSEAEELAIDYYDGHQIFSVELAEGYGARTSAPGYLDCTEWSVFDTLEAAREYLNEYYPDDSEDDESEDV